MSRPTNTAPAQTATFRPVEPLPASDPKIWRKVPGGNLKYALGSRAVVEETTGSKTAEYQRWRWRVIKFGAPRWQTEEKRENAMRRAEFALGVGEMEVEK